MPPRKQPDTPSICPACKRVRVARNQDSPDPLIRAKGRYRLKATIYCDIDCAGLAQRLDPARKARTRTGAGAYARRHCPKGPCTRCGETRQSEVHHKNRDHFDNSPENLERICRWCHAKEHAAECKAAAPKGWATRRARKAASATMIDN